MDQKADFLLNLISAAQFQPVQLHSDSWSGHVPFAAWIIRSVKPSIFVELGTHRGTSYFNFCQSVKEANLKTKCFAVDTWQGDGHSGSYGEEIFKEVFSYNQNEYSDFSQLLRMTFDEAVHYFSNGSIDLLHIDGYHTYEAVKHDFETWLPKLSNKAVVLFHDICVRERDFGVWKLWKELKLKYPFHLEFTHSKGLGVLYLANDGGSLNLEWLFPNYPHRLDLQNYFSSLGFLVREKYLRHRLEYKMAKCESNISELYQQVVSLKKKLQSIQNKAVSNPKVTEQPNIFPTSHWKVFGQYFLKKLTLVPKKFLLKKQMTIEK